MLGDPRSAIPDSPLPQHKVDYEQASLPPKRAIKSMSFPRSAQVIHRGHRQHELQMLTPDVLIPQDNALATMLSDSIHSWSPVLAQPKSARSSRIGAQSRVNADTGGESALVSSEAAGMRPKSASGALAIAAGSGSGTGITATAGDGANAVQQAAVQSAGGVAAAHVHNSNAACDQVSTQVRTDPPFICSSLQGAPSHATTTPDKQHCNEELPSTSSDTELVKRSLGSGFCSTDAPLPPDAFTEHHASDAAAQDVLQRPQSAAARFAYSSDVRSVLLSSLKPQSTAVPQSGLPEPPIERLATLAAPSGNALAAEVAALAPHSDANVKKFHQRNNHVATSYTNAVCVCKTDRDLGTLCKLEQSAIHA